MRLLEASILDFSLVVLTVRWSLIFLFDDFMK